MSTEQLTLLQDEFAGVSPFDLAGRSPEFVARFREWWESMAEIETGEPVDDTSDPFPPVEV